MPPPRSAALLQVALSACLWGLWALFLRPSGLSGPQCALLNLGLMALPALWLAPRVRGRERGATWALLGMAVADALNCWLYFAALQRGPLVVGVLTHYLAPLLVTLSAPLLLGERLSRRALLATPLLLAALALVLGRPEEGGATLATAALGAGSAVGYAGVVLGARRASRAYSALEVTSLHSAVSVGLLLLVLGRQALPPLAPSTLWALGGALLCGLGATTLFNGALSRVRASVAGALTYLEPLTAALVGWALFGERLGLPALVGGLAVLGLGAWVALGEAEGEAPGLGRPGLVTAPSASERAGPGSQSPGG